MSVKRIDPERAQELLATSQGFTYLDVRLEEEFRECHVPESKNIPVMVRGPGGVGLHMNTSFVETVAKHFGKDSKIILGCTKGGRSGKAAQLLVEHGFSNIYDMRGGLIGETDPLGKVTFPGWENRGLPTTTNCGASDILT